MQGDSHGYVVLRRTAMQAGAAHALPPPHDDAPEEV